MQGLMHNSAAEGGGVSDHAAGGGSAPAPMRQAEGVQVFRLNPNPAGSAQQGAASHGDDLGQHGRAPQQPIRGAYSHEPTYREPAHNEQVRSFELGEGVEIQGAIRVTNGTRLIFNNDFCGSIESNGQVVVGPRGCITGPIIARELVVHGRIAIPEVQRNSCPIEIKGAVVLEATADVVAGSLHYADTQLEIRRGARVSATLMPHD